VRPRRSLLFWVALALTAAALIPLAIGLVMLRSHRHALLDQTQRLQIFAASNAADRVASYIESLRREAAALERDPLMAGDHHQSPNVLGERPAVQELLADLLQLRAELVGAALVDRQGASLVRAQLREARELVAGALADSSDEELVLGGIGSRWLRLRIDLGRSPERLLLVARVDPLLDILLKADQIGDAHTTLVDSNVTPLLGARTGGDVLPEPLRLQVESLRLSSGAGRYQGADGQEIVAAFRPVDGTPWIVVSQQPRLVADAAQRRMRLATALATVGALLIAAVLSAVGYRLLILPIRRLIRAQAEVAGVDSLPAGGTEIAQLEATFAQLLEIEQERESIGEVFLGRYRVMGKLGRGGSGTVFKGFDPVLQRPVALKAVPLGEAGDEVEAVVSKLQAEAVHLARLNHPHIVSVFDFERRGDMAYIAMERIDGMSLDRYISRIGPLPLREGLAIAAAITDALAAAHGVNLVHGDLKPGNILLGKDGAIKVADFGTAQLGGVVSASGERIHGTAGYIAPEVLMRRGARRTSDLFSLGVVLYQIFSGKRPFGRGSIVDILKRTVSSQPTDLASVRSGLPTELTRLVMRLLAKGPRERPNSAAVVGDVLTRLAGEHGEEWKLDLEELIIDREHKSSNAVTKYLTEYLRES